MASFRGFSVSQKAYLKSIIDSSWDMGSVRYLAKTKSWKHNYFLKHNNAGVRLWTIYEPFNTIADFNIAVKMIF